MRLPRLTDEGTPQRTATAEIWRPRTRLAYHTGVAKRIGELLVEAGVLSQQQLEQALFAQRKDGRRLGQLLIELGLVGETKLTQTLSRQLSVPWVSLYHVDFSRSLLNLVPRAVAEKYSLVPIFVRRVRNQGETLYVAMDDPTGEEAINEVTRASSMPVKPMIACASDIRAAIRVYYLGEPAPEPPSTVPRAAPQALPLAQPGASSVGLSPVARAAPTSPREDSAGAPAQVAENDGGAAGPPSKGDQQPKEVVAPRRVRPRLISLTLLDGTTIGVPAPKKGASAPDADPSGGVELSDQLTARDLVSALRAVAHGADASEILGKEPRWEAMFSALLSILLRKGLIADWEFIEEFRKI
jgi:type IV pilus assembly protein PilB